jgi:hypothetical protein
VRGSTPSGTPALGEKLGGLPKGTNSVPRFHTAVVTVVQGDARYVLGDASITDLPWIAHESTLRPWSRMSRGSLSRIA